MTLPLIAGFLYILFALVRMTLSGMDVVEQARYETFRALNNQQPTEPLALFPDVLDGAAETMATKQVEYEGWLKGAGHEVKSGSQSIAGTWDHRTAPFHASQGALMVHREPLTFISQSGLTGGIAFGVVWTFGQGLNLPNHLNGIGVLGQLSNAVVYGAGWYLDNVIGRTASAIAEALSWANWFGQFDGIISWLRNSAEACHQVFRAAQGLEVNRLAW